MKMTFLRKTFSVIGIFVVLIMTVSCMKEEDKAVKDPTFNKGIARVEQYNQDILDDFEMIDWRQRALAFDELVFNKDASGKYLPLIWEDKKYDTFGLTAYVGDERMNQDGEQEAVTNIASILSASLLGADKSKGTDYVEQLGAFYSEEERIILNNPAGSSETTSMWYLIYPAILFAQVSDVYSDNETIRTYALHTIESWYEAYEVMYNDGHPDFDYTGFNFLTKEPYRNDVWTEPDSAVGIGLLMYYGYELTGDEKYLEASINSLEYVESYFGSPLYEVLMYFSPYLAAKLNVLHGADLNVTQMLNDTFSETAIPRGGWGSIVGKWGDYGMNGLFGSTSDGGGYAFAMNTFAAAGAVVPVVQYDSRYAKSIGEWMLHLVNNSRYYFASETNPDNQSCTYVEACQDIDSQVKEAIPYEGIRKESQGRSPWFGGDPTVYDWAETDFSLYSGAHTGILASLVEETDVKGILRLNLQATQFYNEHDFETFLIYNPYDEAKEISYEVQSDDAVDLFNTLTNEVIVSGVTDAETIEIQSEDALVIVELPIDSEITRDGKNYYVGEKFISHDLVTLNILNHKNNDTVSGTFTLDLGLSANYEAAIDQVIVDVDGETFDFKSGDKIKFRTKDFSEGSKKIKVTVQTEDGSADHDTIRLRFK